MITERTLKSWRREALRELDESNEIKSIYCESCPSLAEAFIKDQQKIVRMTQELLDQHLMKGRKDG